MSKQGQIILCEGMTDQILISYYLIQVSGWKYIQKRNDVWLNEKNVEWYEKEGKIVGIWATGGNDFRESIKTILKRVVMDDVVLDIIIVTDHDEENEVQERICRINETVRHWLDESQPQIALPGKWYKLKVKGGFSEIELNFYLLLIPQNENGALEHFALHAIAENDSDAHTAIEQVKDFIKNFRSTKYLIHRRDKQKAELSVSLSVFSPDKVFMTMNEYLGSVDWKKYETYNKQFAVLSEMG